MLNSRAVRTVALPIIAALIAVFGLVLLAQNRLGDSSSRRIDVRSSGASLNETANSGPKETLTDHSAASEPKAPPEAVPRVIDLGDCVTTSAYEYESAASASIRQVYLDPKQGPGGPVVSVSGPTTETKSSTRGHRREFLPERDPMGKVMVSDDVTGEVLTSLDSKRASSDQLLSVANHVLDGGARPGTLTVVQAPTSPGPVRVLGTSCEIGDLFYGVEVVSGGLFERAVYMLSVDPVRTEESNGTTIAVFGPAGQPTPLRALSEVEWHQMRQQQYPAPDAPMAGPNG